MDEIKAPKIALTFGSAWADLFESSLARRFAGITHIPLGNPKYKISPELLEQLIPEMEESQKQDLFTRLNSPSRQASEVEFKLDWYVRCSTHIFVDSGLLDTAVGHHILVRARDHKKPIWAVALDDRSSPLAAAFLRGVIYPATADDLVTIILQNSQNV